MTDLSDRIQSLKMAEAGSKLFYVFFAYPFHIVGFAVGLLARPFRVPILSLILGIRDGFAGTGD